MLEPVERSWKQQNVCKWCYINRAETTVTDLLLVGQCRHMRMIVIVASTNNAVEVIRKRLFGGTNLFSAKDWRWDHIFLYHCFARRAADILNVPCVNQLQRTLDWGLSMDMIDNYVQYITRFTFSWVYRTLSNIDIDNSKIKVSNCTYSLYTKERMWPIVTSLFNSTTSIVVYRIKSRCMFRNDIKS